MFTNPGSRADLLLTLARLALPDALRRGGQAPVVAVGLVVLYLVVATAASLPLLSFLFGIEDELLRRHLLNLGACVVSLLWLLAQVVLRQPVNWLLDLEPFLPLPAAYRDLYLLRLGCSLVGYWLVGLGPAALYLLATRTEGPVDILLASAALAATVLLFGRLAAILTLLVDRLVESLIGLFGLLLLTVAAVQAVRIVIDVVDGEAELEAVAASVRDAEVLAAMSYTPPGLLVAIFDTPGALAPNILQLAVLLFLLAAAAGLEYRLLLRQYLSRPGGDRRTASPVTPLAGLLRRRRQLSPATCLTLVELECCLRAKGVRWAYVICLGYATYAGVDLLLGLMTAALLAVLLLNSVRTEKPPPSCQVWRESLALPLSAFRIFRTPARVPVLLVVPVVVLATSVGLARVGSNTWPLTTLAAALAAALVTALLLLADAVYSLVQLYWPKRRIGAATEPELENLGASAGATLPMAVFLFLTVFISRLLERPGNGLLIASLAASALLAAGLSWRASTVRQRREIESRARDLLLKDPAH